MRKSSVLFRQAALPEAPRSCTALALVWQLSGDGAGVDWRKAYSAANLLSRTREKNSATVCVFAPAFRATFISRFSSFVTRTAPSARRIENDRVVRMAGHTILPILARRPKRPIEHLAINEGPESGLIKTRVVKHEDAGRHCVCELVETFQQGLTLRLVWGLGQFIALNMRR
jgi:hypothetical protein